MPPPRDWENWMWQQAQDLLSEAEKIRWSFLETAAAARNNQLFGHPSWGPQVNLIETEDAFWVVAALPGVDLDQTDISIDDEFLVLRGRRAMPEELRRGRHHVYEIQCGPFQRRLRLPQGYKLELGERNLQQGLLWIELRKA